ncbi:MAG: 50S ribosomal protein L4 [Candidatus Saccharibacteria bacterium]|nr:50S ribosomal protein L4 [Candidatus Saccharibacteria bacterium]
MAVPTYTKAGAKASAAAKLDKKVFNVDVKSHDLLKQAYITYMNNGRTNNARTLKRGEVRGGGRKPWRQKGTGRARFGSIRVPIWRGGGITFGPTGEENYSKRLSTKMKRTALRQALSLKAKDDQVVVIDSFEVKSGKTADAAKLMKKMDLRKSVIVVDQVSDETKRAVNNLPDITVVDVRYVNVFDVLNASQLVCTKKALELIERVVIC